MQVLSEQLANASILVVGDVMLDRYWFGDVERISPEAPVPIVHVQREEFRLGGAGNVALNAASLGARVTLMSVVGDDAPAMELARLLDDAGIARALKVDASLATTVKLRVSGRSQQLLRIDFEKKPSIEALEGLVAEYQDIAGSYDAILLSDYGKGGLSHIAGMVEMARSANKPILIDPKGSNYSAYAGATVLTPNRSEFGRVAGAWDTEERFATLAEDLRRSLDLDALLVTRSEDGMSLFDADGHFHVPAEVREVFDVTGAGDTVIATLTTLIAIGVPLREAVPMANKAGGIVVGKFGAATIKPEELFA